MSKLSHLVRGAGLAVGLVAFGAGAASAETPKPKPDDHCFFVTQWRGWKSPRPDVLYLGVNLHDVYKVQLSVPQPELQWPDAQLISINRGGASICDALDLQLNVSDDHGFREALIAESIVKLTPDEVAAIPPKFRP